MSVSRLLQQVDVVVIGVALAKQVGACTIFIEACSLQQLLQIIIREQIERNQLFKHLSAILIRHHAHTISFPDLNVAILPRYCKS